MANRSQCSLFEFGVRCNASHATMMYYNSVCNKRFLSTAILIFDGSFSSFRWSARCVVDNFEAPELIVILS